MQNLPKAAFSLNNYVFDKISVDISNAVTTNLSISFDTSGVFNSANSSFELVFVVDISCKDTGKSVVEIRCKGLFAFKELSDGIASIPDFFYNNSIAILFPYVRAYISMVTTQANIPGIILPTMNLSSLGEKLKKNTSIK